MNKLKTSRHNQENDSLQGIQSKGRLFCKSYFTRSIWEFGRLVMLVSHHEREHRHFVEDLGRDSLRGHTCQAKRSPQLKNEIAFDAK